MFTPFPADTDYFGRPEQAWMLNFRVGDLDAMLAQLHAAGASIDSQEMEEDVGGFAWLTDPEANRIQLWEPTPDVLQPLTGAADPEPNTTAGDRQIRSLVLYVGLVGSRPIWPAHVGCLVDPVDQGGTRRIVWMINGAGELDEQRRQSQVGDRCLTGQAIGTRQS